jgi:hypothetical protein
LSEGDSDYGSGEARKRFDDNDDDVEVVQGGLDLEEGESESDDEHGQPITIKSKGKMPIRQ